MRARSRRARPRAVEPRLAGELGEVQHVAFHRRGDADSRWSAARSRLVSTVTAITSGRRTDSSTAAAAAPSAAALIMASRPRRGH